MMAAGTVPVVLVVPTALAFELYTARKAESTDEEPSELHVYAKAEAKAKADASKTAAKTAAAA